MVCSYLTFKSENAFITVAVKDESFLEMFDIFESM
ncbi:hypothetical protein L3N51_01278 [Metallosphaera sp. J1]|nr:hypothetical protein [Metallosphaera javensis (ex Hofmann et al. 2022)]